MKSYGTTVFCDDIRDEVTGKKTYVGVYQQDMIIAGGFPAIIPQFALAITYLEPIDTEARPVSIKVFVPSEEGDGDIAVEIELPIDRDQAIKDSDRDPLSLYRGHVLSFRISPFLIPKEGYVKVRAFSDNEEIRLGSLRIRAAHPGEVLGQA